MGNREGQVGIKRMGVFFFFFFEIQTQLTGGMEGQIRIKTKLYLPAICIYGIQQQG